MDDTTTFDLTSAVDSILSSLPAWLTSSGTSSAQAILAQRSKERQTRRAYGQYDFVSSDESQLLDPISLSSLIQDVANYNASRQTTAANTAAYAISSHPYLVIGGLLIGGFLLYKAL